MKELNAVVQEIIRRNVGVTVINGNFTVILNEGDSSDQILKYILGYLQEKNDGSFDSKRWGWLMLPPEDWQKIRKDAGLP